MPSGKKISDLYEATKDQLQTDDLIYVYRDGTPIDTGVEIGDFGFASMPSVYSIVQKVDVFVIPTATWTKIDWNQPSAVESHVIWDDSTNKFIIPAGEAGSYIVFAQILFQKVNSERAIARFAVNGSAQPSSVFISLGSGGSSLWGTVLVHTYLTDLSVGDDVKMEVYAYGANSQVASSTNSRFSIWKSGSR